MTPGSPNRPLDTIAQLVHPPHASLEVVRDLGQKDHLSQQGIGTEDYAE